MKKILLITFEYPISNTYCGGVGQIVKQCRESLLSLGYDVYVLISSEFLKKYPVKVLPPDNSHLHFSSFWAFQRRYDLNNFDYIIQHFVNWTRELRKLKKRKNKPPKIIYHFHSILRREKDSGFKTLNNFLLNQERMIELSDKIICPSRYEYDNFIRYFPAFSEKITLLENTIETFSPEKDKIQSIRDKYKIRKTDVVAIYVGRLERIKGADILINSLPKILMKHKNFKLIIVGKILKRGLYKKLLKIQKKFPNQVLYVKYLQKNALFQLYYLSHIYINASLSESFSLAAHESALCNNALLLNQLPVFDKFKEAALFFTHYGNNKNNFITQCEYLIKDKKLQNKLSRKAAKISKDFLAKNRLREDFTELFQGLSRC